MRKLLQVVRLVAFKAALYWIAWLGVADGAVWAANLFKFVTVGSLVVSILLCLNADEDEVRVHLADGPVVPTGFVLAIYFGLACFLAAYGWFGYATMTALTGILDATTYSRAMSANARAKGVA